LDEHKACQLMQELSSQIITEAYIFLVGSGRWFGEKK